MRQPIVRHCSCTGPSPRRPLILPMQGSSRRQLMPHVGSDVGSDTASGWISKIGHLVRAMFCAPGRNRTYDRQIRRLLLYPLSYGGRERRPCCGRLAHHCSAGSCRRLNQELANGRKSDRNPAVHESRSPHRSEIRPCDAAVHGENSAMVGGLNPAGRRPPLG